MLLYRHVTSLGHFPDSLHSTAAQVPALPQWSKEKSEERKEDKACSEVLVGSEQQLGRDLWLATKESTLFITSAVSFNKNGFSYSISPCHPP